MLTLLCVATVLSAAAAEQSAPPVPDGFHFAVDVVYGSQSERQRLDILHPVDVQTARPAIVHFHSGGWYTGGKGGEKTFAMLRAFADAGYVAVSIGYRLADEAVFPAAVEDCKLALRWLRENAAQYGIDPERIGVIGASAGGHLAAMLAVTAPTDGLEGAGGVADQSSSVLAAVAVCAPLDLTKPLSLEMVDEDDPLVARFLGGPPAAKQDAARRASPITYARPGIPPIFLIHGKADRRVHMNQSVAMAQALEKAGAAHQLALIEEGKHGMDIAREEKIFASILQFFDTHVKNKGAAQ